MSITVKDITASRKTFFIAPDDSFFPESYLEDYFSLGYECYFVKNDRQVPIKDKINNIISVFKDSIVIFNIDAVIPNINWIEYINQLNAQYGKEIIFGVVYVKRQEKKFKAAIEITFKQKIGIRGECIQLEYQKKLNFAVVQKALYDLQAQGRRKNIRGLCTKTYTFSFSNEGINFNGVLQDISLSHFSFISYDKNLDINIGTIIKEFNFFLNGLVMRTPVALIIKREINDGFLYIFAFYGENGTVGLSERYRQSLGTNIYKLNCDNFQRVMDKISAKLEEGQEEISTEELQNLIIDN